MTTPQQEERDARRRERLLERARRAAAEKRRVERTSTIWPDIKRLKRTHGCTCDLRPGMNLSDLRKLGAGCTAPRWVCPVLDAYRRRLGG